MFVPQSYSPFVPFLNIIVQLSPPFLPPIAKKKGNVVLQNLLKGNLFANRTLDLVLYTLDLALRSFNALL